MADKRIDQLDALVTQSTTDLYETSLNGAGSRKETRAQQLTYLNANIQLPSTDKVTGLNQLKYNVLNVVPGGSDVGATGSPIKPFGTVTAAYAAGVALSAPFVVMCASGTHTFGNLALVPFGFIQGYGKGITQLNCTGNFTIDAVAWASAASAPRKSSGISYCTISFTNGMNLQIDPSLYPYAGLYFNEVEVLNGGSYLIQGFVDGVYFNSCSFNEELKIVGTFAYMWDSTFNDIFLVSTRNPDTLADIIDVYLEAYTCNFFQPLELKSFGAFPADAILSNPTFTGASNEAELTGNNTTITIDANTRTPTIIAGTPTINYTSIADNVLAGFTPVTYTPANTRVKAHLQAIDSEFAEKVTGPESAVNKSLVRFDTTSGKLVKDSNITVEDDGSITLFKTDISGDLDVTQNSLFKNGGFNPSAYSTGTISQTGTALTGSGTTFTSSMAYGILEYMSGGSALTSNLILSYNSATSLTLLNSASISAGTTYRIRYGGISIVGNSIGFGPGSVSYGSMTWNATQNMPLGVDDSTQQSARFVTPVATTITGNTTLGVSHWSKRIIVNSASAVTITLPQQSTTATVAGVWLEIENIGAGDVTIAKQGAETLTGNTLFATGARGKIFRDTTTNWDVTGGTSVLTAITNFNVGTVGDVTYSIVKTAGSGTITNLHSICRSGTCTATFKINGNTITATANSVSTTSQTQAATAANTFVTGDYIQVTISSNSSCLDMNLNVEYTYRQNVGM